MPRKTNAHALSSVDPSFEMSDFSVSIRVTITKGLGSKKESQGGGRRVFVVRQ